MIQFSIFLPVRNGWPYVQDCVTSILAQTYPHFELTVLDNQSTDETLAWLRGIDDPRMHIRTSSTSLSIQDSWARVKGMEKLEFMTLIGHDDVLDPEYLSAICSLVERFPDAGLYQTGSRLINSDGSKIRDCRAVPERETASEYLRARFAFERDVFGTGYVMRSRDYDRVGGIPPFERLFFADDALWLSLLRDSYKASDARELFGVRIHPKSESASLPSAWSSILKGLGQFTGFLRDYVVADPACSAVVQAAGPSFLLAYHRNAYIYALVEACQAGKRIPAAVVQTIVASLERDSPAVAAQLRHSLKISLIEGLNASPLRSLVPALWRGYYRFKTRPQ